MERKLNAVDAIGFAVLGIGAYLIYSAYKGVSPLTHAKAVLAASASPAATAPKTKVA